MSVIPVGWIVKRVDGASGALGVNVAVKPSVVTAIVPATGIEVLLGNTRNVDVVTVSGLMRLLNCT